MTTSPDEQQSLQNRLTNEIVDIPVRVDPKTKERIVLWRDIQDVFENAKSIRDGTSLVPFITDESFEQVKPLRIAYRPGVVLEVVIGGHDRAGPSREVTDVTSYTPAGNESNIHDSEFSIQQPPGCATDISLLAQNTEALAGTDITANNQPLAVYSMGMPREAQHSLQAFNQLYHSYSQAIMSGQEIQATKIMQSMDQQFGQLQIELVKNKELHEQLVRIQQEMKLQQQQNQEQLLKKQQEMQQLQEQNNEELLTNQEKMLQMQKEALVRLAVIQSRVEAVLTQNYELHEYPIPRLFIVLPKEESFRSKITSLFSDHFRLYFLCECGTHTMTKYSKTPHEIHLAKHKGYDLEKPTEFFERYGTYVLAMMYMIKFGITAAGLVVPSLASSKIVDGLDTAQKQMVYLKKNIAPLVDSTIKFLNVTKRNNEAGDELAADGTEFDQLEALEGADLRQLESYLMAKDEGRVLGNLYRIVTLKGHVKWVCLDHYRASYQESAIQQLREIVEVNNGIFIEQEGKIKIEIESSIQAKQFYDAMVKAHGIQELNITLGWDATMDELQTFTKAVTQANVARLMVNGSNLKNPVLDFVNQKSRFNPILELASGSRLESLQLKNFDDFFTRISKPTLGPASRLRVFSMDSGVPLKKKVLESFNNFLKHCTALTTLELELHHQFLMTLVTDGTLSNLRSLGLLMIDCGRLSIIASVSQGKIRGTTVTVVGRLGDLKSDDLKFIKQGHLTRLVTTYIPQKVDEVQMIDILRQSPKLSHLYVTCQQDYCLAITNTAELELHNQGFIKLALSDTFNKLHNLQSLVIDCRRLSISANSSHGGTRDLTVTIERLGDFSTDDIKFLQQGHLTQLAIKYTPQEVDEGRLVDLLRHSPTLSHIQIGCQVDSSLAITNLVVSTRETILQEGGSSCLRTFELMEERFVSIDDDEDWDYRSRIQCRLSFDVQSTSFEMRTWIRLQFTEPITDEDPVCDFVRTYGWSVVSLNGQWTFNDHFAAILDDATSTTGDTQIERLHVTPYSLTADPGIRHLDNIISRSQSFDELGLCLRDLDEEDQLEKGKQLMRGYREMLNSLELFGYLPEQWLPQIASWFPTRGSFPNLVSIEIGSYSRCDWPSSCLPWIVAMVSSPTRPSVPSTPPQSTAQSVDAKQQPSALKQFSLKWMVLQPDEWKLVIGVIDLSVLQQLSFEGSNFSHTQLKLLIDRFPDQSFASAPPSLFFLNLRDTDIADSSNTHALYETLRKKVPLVKVAGIGKHYLSYLTHKTRAIDEEGVAYRDIARKLALSQHAIETTSHLSHLSQIKNLA